MHDRALLHLPDCRGRPNRTTLKGAALSISGAVDRR
jgi:hypothetical protein